MNNKDKNIDAGDVTIESLDKSEVNSKQYKDNETSKKNDKELEDGDNSTIKKIIKG